MHIHKKKKKEDDLLFQYDQVVDKRILKEHFIDIKEKQITLINVKLKPNGTHISES
jgi:hypothetical protein